MSEELTVSLRDCIAPSFFEVHREIKKGDFSEFWLAGGRGSMKSSFAALESVLGVMIDPTANAICFRKVGDTLKTSVFANVLWAIDMLQVSHMFESISSPPTITYKPTGQKIIFKGLDKVGKLKSIKLKKGNFKIVWFEELEEFNGMKEIRSVLQSVIRGDDQYLALFSYNPPQDPNSWVNVENNLNEETFELTTDVPYRYISQTTYLTAPAHWLGDGFMKQAEALKERDLQAYEHEYLGHAMGNIDRLVFNGKYEIREFETPPASEVYQRRFFMGADWGFAKDPTVCVRCFIQDRILYIDYDTGGVGIAMNDIAPKIMANIPDATKWMIYGDCARPETVHHLNSTSRLNVKSAPKWKGSVEDGIEYLRAFDKIVIHTRCAGTAKEFKHYSHKVDKNTQEVLPALEDKFNHYIDALRYALSMYIKKKVSILDVI